MDKNDFINNFNPYTGYVSYRSLYEYLTLYKGYKKVSPIYKSAFIQHLEVDDMIIIACENYDSDSMVTDSNYDKICKMVTKHEKDIVELYGKDFLTMHRYSYE